MKPLPITAIIITHRQDKRLTKTLNSLTFTKQILIVDHPPKKNDWSKWTKNYKLKILTYPQPLKNFAKIRNWALKQAEEEWVLFIDSDEWFQDPQQARSKIKSALNKRPPNPATTTDTVAWQLKRQDLFWGNLLQYGEAGQQWHTRFLKKDNCQFTRPVHEVVETRGQTAKLDIKLIHHAHLRLNEFLNDVSTYAHLEAQQRFKSIRVNGFYQFKIMTQLLFFPLAKFVLNYLLKLGFLDGQAGFIYAWMMSLHSALVRIFQLELILKKK